MLALVLALLAAQQIDTTAARGAVRTIAIDERFAADRNLTIGSRLVLAAEPGAPGDTVIVGAITRRTADPSELARAEYRVRLHLDHLQTLTGYGDRADRFAVAAVAGRTDSAARVINGAAFGFRAHRSRDIAVETSRTFLVVTRFHRAIGVITVVASAIFLLCIMLLKIEERRRDVAALRLMGMSRATVIRSIMLEAMLIALLGSAAGVLIGWAATGIVNWHYQGVYRTPLAFALVTPGILAFAVALSVILGLGAGYLAALRLVRVSPLSLLGR